MPIEIAPATYAVYPPNDRWAVHNFQKLIGGMKQQIQQSVTKC